jgi:demethylmenaquinone methyltransferase/2-methoxy-6-polyprenyl-1,4-benzoquinol methylase
MPEPAPSSPAGNPARPAEVRAMFDRIAPRYEAMNTLMTLGLDAAWRRRAVRAARLAPGMRAVDVACGSGSLTRELARAVGRGGDVVGVDVSAGMLDVARRRAARGDAPEPRYVEGDALALPVPDAAADAVTIAFGLRNMADYGRCIAEMGRVTRPGGRVVVLEIAEPSGRIGRILSATWFGRIVPLLGRLAGDGDAYRYLPDSVRSYPGPDAIARLMEAAGLADVRWHRLPPGLVTLHVGRRAG